MKSVRRTVMVVLAFITLMSSCSNDDPAFESVVQQAPPPPQFVWDQVNWNEVFWE